MVLLIEVPDKQELPTQRDTRGQVKYIHGRQVAEEINYASARGLPGDIIIGVLVVGGSASEGMDYQVATVVMCGIPFPPADDLGPPQEEKMAIQPRQACGRVMRAPSDRGLVVRMGKAEADAGEALQPGG